MYRLGFFELLIILIIILLFVGKKKLPELAQTIKDIIASFKKERDADVPTTDETEANK